MNEWSVAVRDAPLILKGIYEYNIACRFGPLAPHEWLFPVTYRCNARCVMCNIWQGSHTGELATEEWDKVLADPFFRSVQSVSLTGGEPTLREDLPQLARLLTQRLPALKRVTLTTNALSTPRVVSHCEQIAGLCRSRGIGLFVGISVDGIGPVHDEMRGIPGAFNRVRATIAELRKLDAHRLRLGINCTLTRRNLQDAENVRRWCHDQGLPADFIVASFAERYYGNVQSESDLSFTNEQCPQLATFLNRLSAHRSFGNPAAYFYADAARMLLRGSARTTPCVFQKDGFILDARGDMQYCMFSHVLGNVREQPAGAIYFAPQSLAHRREVIAHACRNCTITCFLELGLAKDAFKYLRFLLERRT